MHSGQGGRKRKLNIIYNNDVSEDEVLEVFKKYSKIEDVTITIDKTTSEQPGVCIPPKINSAITDNVQNGLICTMGGCVKLEMTDCPIMLNIGEQSVTSACGIDNPNMQNMDIPENTVMNDKDMNQENLPHLAATSGVGLVGDGRSEQYSNPVLPPKQPIVLGDRKKACKLRLECQPFRLPNNILADAFSTFGSLIEAYLLPGRNYGMVLYGSRISAEAAIETLNEKYLEGSIVKLSMIDC